MSRILRHASLRNSEKGFTFPSVLHSDIFPKYAQLIPSMIPIPGTPLENLPLLSEDEILRTVAIFRYINPEAEIRLGAGRKLISGNGRTAFTGGASATITGNMLTTTGSTVESDREMLTALGRVIHC